VTKFAFLVKEPAASTLKMTDTNFFDDFFHIFRPELVLLVVLFVVLLLLVGATSSKKPKAPSFQIGSG